MQKKVYSNSGTTNQPSTSVGLWLIIILCFTSRGELVFHDSLYIQCAIDHNVCILMILVELSWNQLSYKWKKKMLVEYSSEANFLFEINYHLEILSVKD
jgi:ACR3 family arsenite efflux pump ArsB